MKAIVIVDVSGWYCRGCKATRNSVNERIVEGGDNYLTCPVCGERTGGPSIILRQISFHVDSEE